MKRTGSARRWFWKDACRRLAAVCHASATRRELSRPIALIDAVVAAPHRPLAQSSTSSARCTSTNPPGRRGWGSRGWLRTGNTQCAFQKGCGLGLGSRPSSACPSVLPAGHRKDVSGAFWIPSGLEGEPRASLWQQPSRAPHLLSGRRRERLPPRPDRRAGGRGGGAEHDGLVQRVRK
eukprot:gene12508-biopygen3477